MEYGPGVGADGPVDLCSPFMASLPITGASIAIVVGSGARLTLTSTDAVAARIDELQFELGEGPQWIASRDGEFLEIPDTRDGHDAWPVFGAALADLPVGALHCVPVRMGAVTLGVASLYSAKPRQFTADERATAMAIGTAIAGPAAREALRSAAIDESPIESETSPALRREVHQATGILIVQLNTTATIAYARLQAYAFANGRTVHSVARDVVAGSLTLDEPGS